MIEVKECYIRVCQEKDTLEATLRQKFEQEQQLKEEKVLMEILINPYNFRLVLRCNICI